MSSVVFTNSGVRSILELKQIALGWMTARQIESEDEDSKEASILNRVYTSACLVTQSDVPWGCLMHRLFLNPSKTFEDTTQNGGFRYQFQLPDTLLRLIKVEPSLKYSKIDKLLLTDATAINIEFTEQSGDVLKYSPKLVHAIALMICALGAKDIPSASQSPLYFLDHYKAFIDGARKDEISESTIGMMSYKKAEGDITAEGMRSSTLGLIETNAADLSKQAIKDQVADILVMNSPPSTENKEDGARKYKYGDTHENFTFV